MKKIYIGENFKQLQERFSLKKAEIARKVDCSTGYLSEIEANEKSPGAGFLFSLNREFGVNINWLLTGEGQPRAEQNEPTTVAETAPAYDTEQPQKGGKPNKAETEGLKILQVYGVYDPTKKAKELEKRIQELEEENKVLTVRLDQTERMFKQALTIIKPPVPEEAHA